MLDVKEATAKAFEYFATIYGTETSGLRLEEVELSDDGYWLVTLSFQPGSDIALLFNKAGVPREYKVFRILANTGEVKSMKIRKVG